MNHDDNTNHSNHDAMKEAMFRQILEKEREKNPHIGAQLGAEDIWHTFMTALQEPDGRINAKTILLWTSALAGYACQASAWEKAVLEGKMPELFTLETNDGMIFYMGDGINGPLLTNQYSIWSLAAGICRKLEPDRPLPDIEKLVAKSASMLGDKDYKMWGEINPYHMIEKYGEVWKQIRKKVTVYCKHPDEWSLLFGLVLQKALEMTIKVTPPEQNCLEMAMENALFTSKINMPQ